MAAPGSGKIGRSLKEVKSPRKERIQIPVEWEIARERQRKSADVGETEPGRGKSREPCGESVITASQVDTVVIGLEVHQPGRGARAGAAPRAGERIQPVDLSVMVQLVDAGVEPGERAERDRSPEYVAIQVRVSPINQGAVRFGPIHPRYNQGGVLRQPPTDVGWNVEEDLVEGRQPRSRCRCRQPQKRAGRNESSRSSELSHCIRECKSASGGHRP